MSEAPEVHNPEHLFVLPSENGIILDYSADPEKLILTCDSEWRHWSIYNSFDGRYCDDWFQKVGNLFAWSVLKRDAFVMHGVIMEWNGIGFILTAASGTGKSTHAALWRDTENAFVINGDRALIMKEGDSWVACGSPWSGSSGQCINRRVPLKAIVVISRDSYNHTEMLAPMHAFRELVARIIAPAFDRELSQRGIDWALNMASELPVIKLHCLPDEEAVAVCKREIEKVIG